jgi:hypothetical protein
VTLINMSAVKRAEKLQLELSAQQAASRRNVR